ncbi:MAG: glycosyltransferase family 2 protein [Gemmatimonadota bacterium]
MTDASLGLLAAVQGTVLATLASRLVGGRIRRPAERPRPDGLEGPGLTIVVACLNEAVRIGPCLRGLRAQGAPVREILIVDSGSTDGTRELVAQAAAEDPRIRLITDPPLPPGWIGKAWALQHGTTIATQPWVLGMDADTEAAPGCAAAVLRAALREGFDVVSFAPCFDGQTAGERWVQPALLVSLLYRTGAAGDPRVRPDRILANGQCFLVRREVLLAHGGYEPVRASFAEDVSLVRHLAGAGVPVGFLDGSRLYRVRSYQDVRQMWREWGRSIDLKDAVSPIRRWGDAVLIALAQGAQLPLLLWLAAAWPELPAGPTRSALLGLTLGLLAMRLGLLVALRGNYATRGLAWWLSPLADPLAAVRIVWSSIRRPRRWRSRTYS